MNSQAHQHRAILFNRLSRVAGGTVFLIGLLVLLGWVFDLDPIKSVFPGLATMKANTALAFILTGTSLWFLNQEDESQRSRFVSNSFAAAALLIGLFTLVEYIFGRNLGIDELLFRDSPIAAQTSLPGRMSPATACNFVLVGTALLAAHGGLHLLAQASAIIACLVSLLALTGYVYSIESLYKIVPYSSMALHTTISFVVLSVGILFSDLRHGLMVIITDNTSGGIMARRLLPWAILLPIVFGWLRLAGQRAGLYDTEFGLVIMVASVTIGLTVLILWNAASLRKIDMARRQTDEERQAAEERYSDLFENANDIIYILDLEGNFTAANKSAERLSGYSRDEFVGMNISDLIAPDHLATARSNIFEKMVGDDGSIIYEMEIVCKDGHRLPLEVSSRLILIEGQAIGMQSIARDLSERKHLEEQLRQAQKMEAVGRLAGGVAHDFNNLLTAILGYSKLTLIQLGRNDPIGSNIEEIERAGERAAALTRQLLAFSRKQILQPVVLNLNEIVTNLKKMLERLISEDIEMIIHLDIQPEWIKADPGQIEQVILNLVVNARDAMPLGGKLTIETLSVYLDESYASTHMESVPGNYAMLAVSDTGTGMDKETQTHIFEPFFTTKGKEKGTGLGLSTVFGIVKQSGGNIWVYSEPGRGTTFKVYLPLVEQPSHTIDSTGPAAEPVRGTETILLVEDEESVRKLARRILEQSGYTVLEAGNGSEALEICQQREKPIDLLITDVVMPGMSGKELARNIKAVFPEMKTLYMSGYTENAIVHHGVLDSDIVFLHKPFSPETLASKVREALAR